MLATILYFLASVVIPETTNLLISTLGITTVILFFTFAVVTFFTIVGLKVHADMNSTVAGAMVIGVGHCLKVVYTSTYNIFSNVINRSVHYFKRLTKSSFISYIFTTILLIILI